jgi:hypothetical protein
LPAVPHAQRLPDRGIVVTTWPEALLTHLVAASTGLEVGDQALVNVLPEEAGGVSVGLFEQPGLEAIPSYGDADAWIRPQVKIITRTTAPADGASAPDPARARVVAWNAYRAALAVADEQLPGSSWRFGAVTPTAPPMLEDVDDRGRHRYSFTATAWLAWSTGPW